MEYSIGDVSKITRVSGKALHQFHLDGLVIPDRIDKFSGRRFYSDKSLHRVEIVRHLIQAGVSLETVKDILSRHVNPGHFLKNLSFGLKHSGHPVEYPEISHEAIEKILNASSHGHSEIGMLEVKVLPTITMAGKTLKSKPDDVYRHLKDLYEACGELVTGSPVILFHDDHQFDDEMEVEYCLPVSGKVEAQDITVREIKGTRAVAVTYKGPLSGLWKAYARIVDYLNDHNLAIQSPSREVILDRETGMSTETNPRIQVEVQFLTGDPDDPGFTRDISRPGYGINAAFDL